MPVRLIVCVGSGVSASIARPQSSANLPYGRGGRQVPARLSSEGHLLGRSPPERPLGRSPCHCCLWAMNVRFRVALFSLGWRTYLGKCIGSWRQGSHILRLVDTF